MGGMINNVVVVLSISVIMCMNTMRLSYGAITRRSMEEIWRINKQGPFLGIVVPNAFEMNPLLQSPSFVQDSQLPYFDFGGRRFRFGKIGSEKVIITMTGLGMLNAGITTQLLINLFKIKGVIHYGVAGNANPNLQIGDVTIPNYWAHTGLWNWQRYGDGENDELALEANGDYTRKIGYLKFSDYYNLSKNGENLDNYLNRVWYQPEEVFPVDGVPEQRQHALWVPVDSHYYNLSNKLEDLELENCVNATTCLPRRAKVVKVERGCSANTFVDNAAYREFLRSKFNVSPVDMETAAVALVCLQQTSTPFIAFRALSDLAGGGSALSNEASLFASLASQNAVTVALQFIHLISSSKLDFGSFYVQ
ncbi:bark storage protein A [Dioscorea cayenensis subsp. rotundata]|uniref:Bark storage protein A n=1 Tax=Dioscorea cayennensis subsp. rotundata TaxID=55577 RepID=A0AB40BAK5_DIOCR|nr:bark storage protein A [Dioscorea cayenensis subsp. rotundata]XP_039123780.1 bark storage protein A [Dioscorea cayenensis subsp. rotundata]